MFLYHEYSFLEEKMAQTAINTHTILTFWQHTDEIDEITNNEGFPPKLKSSGDPTHNVKKRQRAE